MEDIMNIISDMNGFYTILLDKSNRMQVTIHGKEERS